MKMKKTTFVSMGVIGAVLIGMFGLKSYKPTPYNLSNSAPERSAAQNYQNFCAGCHGDQLEKICSQSLDG